MLSFLNTCSSQQFTIIFAFGRYFEIAVALLPLFVKIIIPSGLIKFDKLSAEIAKASS
jgi:hypothetical protein